MQKDFDRWNERKKVIDRGQHALDCKPRDVWWCAVGVNVGSEQHSILGDFGRPVIVLKRLSPRTFWGIPLSTKTKKDVPFRVSIIIEGVENDALVDQMRLYDRNRLLRKISVIAGEDDKKIVAFIIRSL